MRRIVAGVGGVALAALLLGGFAVGVGTAQTADPGTNASFGAEVSAFMQASDAEAESEVDDGMFDAALNRTEDPSERRALVERRAQRLEERQQELRSQRETLETGPPERGGDPRAHAVAARVAVGAAGLERAANETAAVAVETGVDTAPIEEIRSNARGFRGPDIEELTPDVAGPPDTVGPPDEGDRGPPETVGSDGTPGTNRSTDDGSGPPGLAGNRSVGPGSRAVDGSGPPGDSGGNGTRPDDESRSGPPDTAERGSGTGTNGTAPGNESGGRPADRPHRPGASDDGSGPPDGVDPGNESGGPSGDGSDGPGAPGGSEAGDAEDSEASDSGPLNGSSGSPGGPNPPDGGPPDDEPGDPPRGPPGSGGPPGSDGERGGGNDRGR
jgi:hypothetical protein